MSKRPQYLEHAYYGLYYLAVEALAFAIHAQDDWSVFDTSAYFRGYPTQPFVPVLRTYHIIELACMSFRV